MTVYFVGNDAVSGAVACQNRIIASIPSFFLFLTSYYCIIVMQLSLLATLQTKGTPQLPRLEERCAALSRAQNSQRHAVCPFYNS